MSPTRRSLLASAALAAATLALPGFTQEKKDKPKADTRKPVVILATSEGDVHVELDAEKAPITVKNFLQYVEAKHFDGLTFHRVIPGFMIQGGGYTPDMTEKETKAPIKNEASNGLKNKRGSIAMARTSDPDSATAQFFINLADNKFLDHPGADGHGYAVFGQVIQGMEVVDKIAKVETGTRGFHQNVPVKPVVIKTARLRK